MDTIVKYLLVIPAAPLIAAILCGVVGPWLSKRVPKITAWITVAALATSFVASVMLYRELSSQHEQQHPDASFSRVIEVWTWAHVSDAMVMAPNVHDFRIAVTMRADGLSSMMLCMVTFVASLVAIYAMGYMKGDRSYWRFFAYVSLFVFSMTMLVSVSNFVLLFVFWEAVGVCSYLLIGFWYSKPEAAAAGMKAFLVNRVGDIGFALALFLIWTTYGSLDFHDSLVTHGEDGTVSIVPIDSTTIRDVHLVSETHQGVLSRHPDQYQSGTIALAICLLLMLGACGKSAQFPLHIWLPDAMEGPTPVSALIHAATMVTAGIYMVTRCSPLFMASPDALLVVACVGGFTALLGGLIALTQFDLKRVLAYSTISQLGYMFMALGLGSFAGVTAGMFHLFTHAFFKALLFLGAGSVMHSMGHVIDMRRFSGLKKIMPITHATFLLGCLALAGVFPLSGFWSKDAIIGSIHEKAHHLEQLDHGGHGSVALMADTAPVSQANAGYTLPVEMVSKLYYLLYYVAVFTAFLTAVYTFRAYFMTFHGDLRTPAEAEGHAGESPTEMTVPLLVLAVFAALIGLSFLPLSSFAEFIGRTPALSSLYLGSHELEFHMDAAVTSTVVVLFGIGLSAYLYLGGARQANMLVQLFNAPWYQRMFDVNSMAVLQDKLWIQKVKRRADSWRLGWLAAFVGRLLLLVGLVIAAPLILLGFASPYRLSQKKFFFDELYQFCVIKPLQLCAKLLYAIDHHCIDGLVNLLGRLPVWLGGLMRPLQMGLIPFYALSMVLGVLVLILARLLWLPL